MRDELVGYFLEEPKRLKALGRGIASTGCWIAMAAAIGRVAVMTNSLIPRGLHSDEPVTLAGLYPSLPTWWIPETTFAALFTFAVVLLGVWLNAVGTKYERMLRWS